MFKFKRNSPWLVATVVALTISSVATADSSASAADIAPANQSSTSNISDLIAKKGKASYYLEYRGTKVNALDGTAGDGTDLTMNHYAILGWKLSSKWSVSLTQPLVQKIRPEFDAKGKEQKNLYLADTSITFTNSKIASSSKYGTNLSAYMRYYAPTSNTSVNSKGTVDDQRNGAIRSIIIPSKTFMDGALTLSGAIDLRYRLANEVNETTGHNNIRAMFDPVLEYAINDKISTYLEYYTGYLTHNTKTGTWGKVRDEQGISPGVNWTPTKKILVNPFVSWDGRDIMRANRTQIGLNAQYTFL